MVTFNWARVARLQADLLDCLTDLQDAIENDPGDIDPHVVDLVRDRPLYPDVVDHMDNESLILFRAYWYLDRAHNQLMMSEDAVRHLVILDKLNARGSADGTPPRA